jgi:hypothetical protein
MSIQNLYPNISPSLSLDFAAVQQLDPRITFTRASTATYYGTQTAKAEENLFIRSQDFAFGTSSLTGWNKTRTTVGSAVTAPDGSTTAEPLTQATGQTTSGFVSQTVSVTATQYVVSVFAKTNGKNFLRFVEEIGTGSARSSWVDLSTGTAGTTNAGHTITITASTQGFYRVSIVLSVNAVRSGLVFFSLADSDNSTVVVDSGGLIFWGAQLEQRSAVTAYTATTTQPITNYVPQLLTAASGVARFDHNPTTFESLGLLIEESRSNLILQSEDFDTTWAETRATLLLNNRISPAGTLTSDGLLATTDNDTHFTLQTFTGTAASHTFSVYAKTSGLNHVALRLFNGTSQVGLAYYNLSTGATGTVTAGTASIVSVGNGWYRCVLTATLAASASCTADIYLASSDNTNSFAGNGFDGVSLWGAQVEIGAFPTSYVATVASQVTRAADAASMTGTNFSSWYNQAEGTFYLDADMYETQSTFFRYLLSANAGSGVTSDLIGFIVPSNGNNVRASASSGGVSQASLNAPITLGAAFKGAFAYKTDDFAASFNGGASLTDTSGVLPQGINRLYIGGISDAGPGGGSSTHIRKVAYYPIRCTNAQLQGLTS